MKEKKLDKSLNKYNFETGKFVKLKIEKRIKISDATFVQIFRLLTFNFILYKLYELYKLLTD
jgi:hypothetical protein